MAQYRKITNPDLGEITFYPNLGAMGEFEDFYGKPWYLLLGNATRKMWFTLLHKCYEVACKRQKQEVKLSVDDFTLYFTKENYEEIIPIVEKDLMDELGIDLEEIQKKTIASQAEK